MDVKINGVEVEFVMIRAHLKQWQNTQMKFVILTQFKFYDDAEKLTLYSMWGSCLNEVIQYERQKPKHHLHTKQSF